MDKPTNAEVEAAARLICTKYGLDPDQIVHAGEPRRLAWNYYTPVGAGVPAWQAFSADAFAALKVVKEMDHG